MAIHFFPFAYELEYIARGKRLPQKTWVLDEVPVELREVDPADAPIAFEVFDKGEAKATYRAIDRRPIQRLVCPARFGELANVPLTTASLDEMLARVKTGFSGRWIGYPIQIDDVRNTRGDPLPKRSELAVRTMVSDPRDESAARAAKALSGLVAVNGEIWCEQIHGSLEVRVGHSSYHHNVPARVFYQPLPAGERIFSLDRLADALAYAEFESRGNGVECDLEIKDAGLIDWRIDDLGIAMRTMSAMFRTWAECNPGFGTLPAEFYGPYCRVRDFHLDGSRTSAADIEAVARDVRVVKTMVQDAADASKGPPSKFIEFALPNLYDIVRRFESVEGKRLPEMSKQTQADEAALDFAM